MSGDARLDRSDVRSTGRTRASTLNAEGVTTHVPLVFDTSACSIAAVSRAGDVVSEQVQSVQDMADEFMARRGAGRVLARRMWDDAV